MAAGLIRGPAACCMMSESGRGGRPRVEIEKVPGGVSAALGQRVASGVTSCFPFFTAGAAERRGDGSFGKEHRHVG
jgi:hypothetical protein